MNIAIRFLVLFMLVLTACAPQSTATPLPTPIPTNTPLPTSVPSPVPTLEPTQTPLHIVEMIPYHLTPCSWIVQSSIGQTGILQVLYAQSRGFFIEVPEDFTGLVSDHYHRELLFWSEDTQEPVSFLQPPDALGGRLSPDQKWIAFRRDIEETELSEIWVIDVNGNNEKKLATVRYSEVKARNSDEDSNVVFLGFGWVPNTDKAYYYVEIGEAFETFAVVDIHSGNQMQLVEPGMNSKIIFSPDGSQAAILTANKPTPVSATDYASEPALLSNYGELRLVDTANGALQFTLPIQIRNDLGSGGWLSLDYSEDGKYLIGFSKDGIVRVTAKAGDWQNIPLNYTVVAPYIGSLYSPTYTWAGDSTLLVPVTNLPEGVHEIGINDLRADPDASFTIWSVSLLDGIAKPIQTFTGFAPSVDISPNGNYLVFEKLERGSATGPGKYASFTEPNPKMGAAPPPNLLLADLRTGHILRTLEKVYGLSWSSYSDVYIYSQFEQPTNGEPALRITYLGQYGDAPIHLGDFPRNGGPFSSFFIKWLNAERFVIENGCELWDVKLSP